MKKYKFLLCIIALCLIAGGLYAIKVKAYSLYKNCADILKKETKSKKSNDTSPIAIQGQNIRITEDEIEQKAKVYRLNGNKSPEEAAIKHLIERKVLLNKAVDMGYSVTEEEVDHQIDLVKQSIEESDNHSDYENFIKEYGNENAYWADIRDTMKDTMIINQYLDSVKEKYEQANKASVSSALPDTNGLDGWNNRKTEIVNDLIISEDIKVNIDKYKTYPYLTNTICNDIQN